MFGIGTVEVVIVAALVLILFGPDRMPEILRSFGRATGQLRKAVSEVHAEIEDAAKNDDEPRVGKS